MFKKISALSAVGFAFFAMSGCSDDNSTAPENPSGNTVVSCTAKKTSSNTVEMVLNIPGISSGTITTTIDGDKAIQEIYSIYSSSVPESVFQKECEENKREAEEEHDNATVTCKDRTLKITSEEDAEGITIDRLLESSKKECANFENMYKDKVFDFDEDDDDDDDDDDNSPIFTDPSTPSDNDGNPIASNGPVGCMVLNDVENEFHVRAEARDSITIETTDRFSNDSIYSTNIFTFGPKVSQSEIDYFCEDYRTVEIYDSNARVSCDGNTITFSYIETDPYSNFKQSKDDAIAECNLIQQKGSFNTEDTGDTPLPEGDGSDNSKGKATCKISKNSDTEFEMTVSDADTATMSISVAYIDGILEESTTTVFNENLPQSFIDQECAEAKEDALNDEVGSIVTCEGNTVSGSFKMEYPMNPIYVIKSELVAMCNDIQETGIIPDDKL